MAAVDFCSGLIRGARSVRLFLQTIRAGFLGEVAGIIAEHVHADDLAGEIIDEARLIAASAIVRDRLERYFDSLLP